MLYHAKHPTVDAVRYTGHETNIRGLDIVKCTERGDTLREIPKGLEAFGPTCRAVKFGDHLVKVCVGEWVVFTGDDVGVMPDDMFHQQYTQ
jgi:hypothetical protein